MYQWSEMELAIQEAVRQFVNAEIRPHREELEFGDLPPYDILRKLWKTFGIDAMASDSLAKMLAKERARSEGSEDEKPSGSLGVGMGAQAGMGVILIKE